MVIEGSIGPALFEIAFDSGSGSFMQGHEAAFAKLGAPNHQTVWSDILKAKPDCFGHTHSRTCQQSEERAVGLLTQGTITGLRCCLHEALYVIAGKNVRNWSRPRFTAKNRWRQLMGLILSPNVAGKSNHFTKSTSAPIDRGGQSGPLDSDLRANTLFSSCLREDGKAP